MKGAADFKQMALDALRGRWLLAVGTGFVASLLGAGVATGGSSGSGSSESGSVSDLVKEIPEAEQWFRQLSVILGIAVVLLVVWGIVTLIIGGAGKLGYATFNLNLVDRREAAFADLFSQFHRLGDGFCMNFLMGLYIFLWSLLFVIPGIVKGFSYAMTPYILAENPGMTATEAITESRRRMDGNKFRLFCLAFSFIGWELLCAAPVLLAVVVVAGKIMAGGSAAVLLWLIPTGIPSFIGWLFLMPYIEAAYAAFYREISAEAAWAAQRTESTAW